MFSGADYSVRSRVCVGDCRNTNVKRACMCVRTCGFFFFFPLPASLSSKSAQLTPQWVEFGSLRQQYPASTRSLTRPASVVRMSSENVRMTDAGQPDWYPDKRRGCH